MLRDIAIVGAGPVGATLALALADADLDVVVLDARARNEPPRGERSIALSHGARLILERAGVWSALVAHDRAVTPITAIDVSQAGGFGMTRLDAAEQGLPALGYVVSYRALQATLDRALADRCVDVQWGSRVGRVGGTPAYASVEHESGADPLTSRLAVIADGTGGAADGLPRYRVDYRQVAIVARLDIVVPHGGVAYERFTPAGPIALLPEGDHCGLVWTASPDRARELAEMPEARFVDELKQHFGPRASAVIRATKRRSFPLALEFAPLASRSRCVAIGNAAQTLHPIAGQGFNLGLRDAHALARVVVETAPDDIGSRPMLARYARARTSDRFAGIAFTHGLLALFGNDWLPLRAPRGVALTLLDAIAPVKRAFTRAMLHGLH
jgi:2-octaprenyl-6-methoxyphenol hydroxylase